jgi:membrane-associated protease RseP (regulator of RpoE activity)
MTVLIKILQLLLSLSILVIIHELGHFVLAKLFKTRVEKFYLFFDPWFALFKFRKGRLNTAWMASPWRICQDLRHDRRIHG